MEPEVIPAILAKSRDELLRRVSQVLGFVREIQIDVMDGEFVPNKTVGIEDLLMLPGLDGRIHYEFHWMVLTPENWVSHFKGPHMHLVHIETITETSFQRISEIVKRSGGRVGLAINPETDIKDLLPYVPKVERVLVMTVRPGFSGQKYIYGMETKVRKLRELFPKLDIEVDGGVNLDTVPHAYANGANLLAAASAVFAHDDIKSAIEGLKKRALSGCSHKH